LLVVDRNLQYSGTHFPEERFTRDRQHRDQSGIRW